MSALQTRMGGKSSPRQRARIFAPQKQGRKILCSCKGSRIFAPQKQGGFDENISGNRRSRIYRF